MSILAQTLRRPMIKPRWQAPLGVMESVVAYNCRKYGMPLPVLTMPFWEGAGNKVYDLSGNNIQGTLQNGAYWRGTDVDFSGGTDDEIILASSELDFTGSTSFSIFTSVNFIPTASYKNILVKGVSANWGYDLISYTDNTIAFRIIDMTPTLHGEAVFSPVLTLGKYYITCVYDAANALKMYVNGTLSNTTTLDGSVSLRSSVGSNLTIGRFPDVTSQSWDSLISCVIVFPKALTATQIRFLHNNPYFMYEMPEELWEYVAAAGGLTILDFERASMRGSHRGIMVGVG